MKGLKIKLPMRKGSETSLTPKVLGTLLQKLVKIILPCLHQWLLSKMSRVQKFSDATSSADNTLEQVGSYCVSAECAPTLLAIIEKYGDIARNCRLESPKMINYLVEKVCTAVHDLQELPFSKLKKHHLTSVNDVIVLADAAKLDVEWLRDHHDEIREIIVDNIPYYKDLKSDLANSTELLKSTKTSLDNKKLERLKLQAELRMLDCEIENEELTRNLDF
ncbi:hypothetical protein RGQ29_024710 [Quercus rubra]|uniref:Uncharacterized protein n=1 Tax=Quercus rubra TaxID=3512 RepID=A0AAN7EW09_QUERU|nr:hypothetical protein RGQ29_024710 [Quercus rubra]